MAGVELKKQYFAHSSGYGGNPLAFDTLEELEYYVKESVNEDMFSDDEVETLQDTWTIVVGVKLQIKTRVVDSGDPDRGKVLKFGGLFK